MDIKPILEAAESRIHSPCARDRISIFDSSLSSAIEAKESNFSEHAGNVSNLIFQTLSFYRDRKSQAVVEKFIQRCLKRDSSFVKSFSSLLVMTCVKNSKFFLNETSHILLRWSCVLLSSRPELLDVKSAFSRLFGIQSTLLSLELQKSIRLKVSSLRTFSHLLKQIKQAFPLYIAEVVSISINFENVGIVAALLHFGFLEKTLSQENKAIFIDIYLKLILNSRETPPHFSNECFSLLLKNLSHDEFSNKIFPIATKVLKRNPEIIMHSIGFLLSNVCLDMSKYCSEIFPTLLFQARHSEEGKRKDALQVIKNLCAQISDSESIFSAFSTMKSILSGSEGKLTFPYQKLGMYSAIQLLSCSQIGKSFAQIASSICSFLMEAFKPEINEEVKVCILSTLGSWLIRCGDFIPEKSNDFILIALKEKDAVKRSALKCLLESFKNQELMPKISGIVDSLLLVAKSGLSKPAQKVDSIYAFLLMLKLATVDMSADDKLLKEKIWPLFTQKDFPLLANTFVSKLGIDELIALSEFCEILILHFPTRVPENSSFAQDLLNYLVSLSFHKSLEVRKKAISIIKKFHSFSSLSISLLDSFSSHLNTMEDDLRNQPMSMEVVDVSGDSNSNAPSSTLLFHALKNCIFSPILLQAGICARVMSYAHHPLLSQSNKNFALWNNLVAHFVKNNININTVLASDAQLVSKILVGQQGLTSPRAFQSQAATSAISTAMKLFPHDIFPPLLKDLEELSQRKDHDSLSEQEIKIFNTPEGILSSEDGMYVATVVKEKNVKQARGRMKMYDDLDDYEDHSKNKPVLKLSSVSKTIKKDGSSAKNQKKTGVDKEKTAKEEAREGLLKEEEKIRNKLKEIQYHLSLYLQVLRICALSNPYFIHDYLTELISSVMPLLQSPLVVSEAFKTLFSLCSCVAPSLRPIYADVAFAICMVSNSASSVLKELTVSENLDEPEARSAVKKSLVENVIHGIQSSCRNGPLPAATFGAVFPIIEQILLSNTKSKLHDDLLSILTLHSSPYISLPRERMLHSLYHVLGVVPVYQTRISPLLQELCKGLKDDEIHLALGGLFAAESHVRAACLDALKYIPAIAKQSCPYSPFVSSVLWTQQFDPLKANADVAEEIWDMYGNDLKDDYSKSHMISFLSHSNYSVRISTARGISEAMAEYPHTVPETISSLFSLYVKESSPFENDPMWKSREGVGMTIKFSAQFITNKDLPIVITFLISKALADPSPIVRSCMIEAGVEIIDRHGKENISLLLPILENYLEKKNTIDEERYDLLREGVVVFLGSLAKHLSSDDPKVGIIIDRLFEVLNTPSESVQRTVSDCLSSLIKLQQKFAGDLISKMLKNLLNSDKYAERRGAAFGLAGIIKGLGLISLKQYEIMNILNTGVNNKVSPKSREGALFAYECLSEKLGLLFEPYVIHMLPILLNCFSDPVLGVREATDMTAKVIMAHLTAIGVKLILPSILKGLNDKAWRTKQGSVQLLGFMAFCAPRQLSQCLPTIVPKLSEVLTDTHPKVQTAAQTALKKIGSVIRNPEIAALVPTLLKSIADPDQHTKTSLDVLLQTTFVNSVDAASLALLVPIVQRGLRDRRSETKKKAAQIAGNMSSLVTDHKDLLPYLDLLLPELKKVLADPHPEVRTVAARALGSLVKGVGASKFEDLVPWLLETLKSENSSVERSGAAQGLSEVLSALGKQYLENILPDVISNCSNPRASVRDGNLTLLKYLPGSVGNLFQKFLPRVLPAIINGLSDENESVRDAALSAGHVVVDHYALTSLPQLLPAVEEGIFSDSWRIRQCSVELLGDLLFKVAGTSGKVVLEGGSDDEGASTEAQGRKILEVLGGSKRNEILSAIYIARSDITLSVRQAALHVWKTIVSNTPRTLKEIMPDLMRILILSLSSTSSDRRQVAGRTLGELVRKLGDRVLPSIIPILAQELKDESPSCRQGVCIGLSEVMSSTGRANLASYTDQLISTIKDALCDHDSDVRESAGQAFNTLFKIAGMAAVDAIVPSLLHSLEDESTTYNALDGLIQILSVRTSVVLPRVLPKLIEQPLSVPNIHALSLICEVSGSSIDHHLSTILPPLIHSIGNISEVELCDVSHKASIAIVTAVDEGGIDLLLSEIMKAFNNASPMIRRGSAKILGLFCRHSELDLEEEVPTMLSTLIVLLTDNDELTVKFALESLNHVTSCVPKETLPSYLKVVRDSISTAKDKERRKRKGQPVFITGFCLPKSLQPILPVFLQGLMSGSAELREQSADGLGELIGVTAESALKPFVISITGPLIRIIGDRFPPQVKSAILKTLSILISKGGIALKPFLPQLQTTFIKCLHDNARNVRSRAANALGKLAKLNPRVDVLVADVLSNIQNSEGGVRETLFVALKGIMKHSGSNVSQKAIIQTCNGAKEFLNAEEEMRILSARTLGIASQFLEEEDFSNLLKYVWKGIGDQDWRIRHGSSIATSSLLRFAPAKVSTKSSELSLLIYIIKACSKDDKMPVRECICKAVGRLGLAMVSQKSRIENFSASFSELVTALSFLLSDSSSDVRRRSLQAIKSISKACENPLIDHFKLLGPLISHGLKDSNSTVKSAAERTVFHFFKLCKSSENVQASQKFITGLEARRIAKLPELSDGSDDSEAEIDE